MRLRVQTAIETAVNMPTHEESKKFPYYTRKVAEELGIPWLDAAKYGKPSMLDGCHMEENYHLALGQAIYGKIKEILEEEA